MKCTVRNVFPAPRVTWATEPPTFEDLRPVTRMLADKQGLYMVDSRLRLLKGQSDLVYICKVATPYGGPAWTASLREREIRGTQGRDLTIPCSAPSYLNHPSLEWSFSGGEDPSHILTYDSRSGRSVSTAPWDSHVELDGFRVPFGDGSLRLMDPRHSEHTGSYTCRFSVPYGAHTERTDVTIDGPDGARGRKPRDDPEEVTELHVVKADVMNTQGKQKLLSTSSGFASADSLYFSLESFKGGMSSKKKKKKKKKKKPEG
ncbi:hypothetical protein F2P81_019643 [Scophthalmus maximus]|uniref:Ig-like domain-containing protein n=1 Tax=Scophthalmus maximus TaxID=52904 RepID=A0A6A4S028_SCOMX|nr:hypothetical protein F2P81_019643 [Scophthalmus maximus]